MKWKSALAVVTAVVGGAYAALWKLAETKPSEAKDNWATWMLYGRDLAAAILPPWMRTTAALQVVAAVVGCVLIGLLIAWWLKSYVPFQLWRLQRFPAKPSRYLSGTETGLQHAMFVMSLRSAWARWYSAQILAANGVPLGDYELMSLIANSMVLGALADGTLTAAGRLPGQFEAVSIPRHFWHYTCFTVERDDRTIWRIRLRPRDAAPDGRQVDLPKYEDLLVNCEEFEKLFPLRDALTDAARAKFLKAAAKKGASKEELQKLA